MKSFLGNFYRHLAIFIWSHWLQQQKPALSLTTCSMLNTNDCNLSLFFSVCFMHFLSILSISLFLSLLCLISSSVYLASIYYISVYLGSNLYTTLVYIVWNDCNSSQSFIYVSSFFILCLSFCIRPERFVFCVTSFFSLCGFYRMHSILSAFDLFSVFCYVIILCMLFSFSLYISTLAQL